jgi:V-type H+-transporting ATPase subunit a
LENSESYKLDQVESEVRELYRQFQSFRTNNADMLSQRNAAIEEKYVAYAASLRLRGSSSSQESEVDRSLLLSADQSDSPTLGFGNIAGVILQSDQERFGRTIFRATRGNALCEFHLIPETLRDIQSGNDVLKAVFVIYFQGGSDSAMHAKISKICQSFGACIYRYPRSETEALAQISQADQLMEDKRAAMAAYEKFLTDEALYLLRPSAADRNSLVEEWRMFCAKEKSIYATLNLFEGDITLRADCWFPADEEEEIKGLLMLSNSGDVGGGKNSKVSAMLLTNNGTTTGAPTYIKQNDVIRSFQLIVDTYGVPRYKEANPALLSIVTFPFLFGVMFGDIGHGLMLLMLGVWACMQSSSLARLTGPLRLLHDHRFIVVAMGFFAVFAGLIYTEFFAIGVNLFGSKWSCPAVEEKHSIECTPLDPSSLSVYPFGLDPAWSIASNQLLFVNSLKMKISVLFGVTQMLLGIGLKFSNSVFFKNWTDFVFECIPQLAFMLCFFAYMDWMIMYKWVTPGTPAPGLIDTMITMGLQGGGVRPGAELYSGQLEVQQFLFKIGLWSVPLMLIPKPLILWVQHKLESGRQGGTHARSNGDEQRSQLIEGPKSTDHGHEEFEFGEIAIHQAIETIEFVLGTVSHTASYLRLWALSLAHQQLSLVFLQKTLYAAMSSDWWMVLNAIPIYIGFAVFITVTTGILLGMDVMECFLHTLRLHWVEFQSKFYKADGKRFAPFNHRVAVTESGLTGAGEAQ